MKKIVLICNLGMSTSLLVTKMQEAAAKKGLEVSISAHAVGDAQAKAADADVILMGPQVRFNLPKVKALFPHIPVESINTVDYGMVNGEKVLKAALDLMGE